MLRHANAYHERLRFEVLFVILRFMKKQLKIATWNIGVANTINSDKMFDYDHEDLEYFADILKPLGLDVICLQESHSNEKRVLSQLLAKMLDMPFVFDSPRSPSHINKSYQLADAIISKYPIENTQHIRLPLPQFELYFPDGKKARRFDTYLQIANIQGISFANTHLQPIHIFGYSWSEGEGQKLAFETESVFLSNLSTKPLIFSGDFNDPNLQINFSRLLNNFNLTPALDNQPTDVKGNKMDYILHSPEFRVKKSEIIKTDKSDHYLGLAVLEFQDKKF